MEYDWNSIAELQEKLKRHLEKQHADLVKQLFIFLEGDTLVLRGEVASEDCKSNAKRLLLSFDGVFKVRNELIVAGFLESASDNMDDYFGRKGLPTNRELDSKGTGEDGPQPDQPNPVRTVNPSSDQPPPRRPEPAQDFDVTSNLVEVMRHPAIEVKGVIAPGQEIQVEVNLTVNAQQSALPISLGRFSSDWSTIAVRVQLFASWVTEVTVETDNVMILADGTSQPARFRLIVSDDYVAGTPAQVHVSFLHGTRVCGYLIRDFAILVGGTAKKEDDADLDATRNIWPTVVVVPDASGPSLSERV